MTFGAPTADPPQALTTERYRRLRDLFEGALDQPAESREAWIDAAVENGEDRTALRRLLAAHEVPGQLEIPAAELAARIALEPADWAQGLLGQSIGGFRLVRPLGQGGMAAVFLGEREGADFRQLVAVKLLRRGLFSDAEQALFRRERRALAMLSHPNITHLVDGGVTAAGIPYLVMEHVDGVPITEYAIGRDLGLEARLQLFATVCRAVAAAHRRLVVHRDIKPSNILVTDAGEVKLLDFGIAKLLDDDTDDATGSGVAALTRGYAAPEQYDGGPITTATDVHALGVLLHELLLGVRPEAPDRRPSVLAAQLSTDPPVLPVPRLALRRQLRGDLDNILMKAMAPEPERRYGSATELVDDIERHLAAQPVRAHPPSAWYRTRKFVRRHRGGVAVTLVFTLAVLASLAIAVWQGRAAREQAQIAREQARIAQAQALRATEVGQFLEALFQPLEQGTSLAQAPSLRELLDRGVARIEDNPPDDAGVRADLLAMFARIDDTLGETASVRDLAAEAAKANADAYGAHDLRALRARELHARVLRKLGDYAAAKVELEAVRDGMRATNVAAGQDYARLLDALSAVGRETGVAPARLVALQREALAARTAADAAPTPDDLAAGYNNLGGALVSAGEFAEAASWYEKAYAINQAETGDSVDTASNLVNIAQVLSQTGRWTEAAEKYEDARAMFGRIPIDRHPALAVLLLRLCGVRIDLEDLDAAARTCDEAEAMTRELHGATHRNYTAVLARRANLHVLRGKLDAARADFGQARAIARALESPGDRRFVLASIDTAQSRLWWMTGDFAVLRDAMLSVLDPGDASDPRLGPRTGGAFHYASLAALACRRAPDPACGVDRVAFAEGLLGEPQAAQSLLRLPARIALAETAVLGGNGATAITALEAVLAEVGSQLPRGHSLRVQAHRALSALRAQAGDAVGARVEAEHAAAALAALPAAHPLRSE